MTRVSENKAKSAKGSGRGGPRAGAGRPPGSPNRSTTEQRARLSELARSYTDVALAALVEVAQSGSSDSARVTAACAILDRAYGRPACAPVEPVAQRNLVGEFLAEIQARGSRMPIYTDDDDASP